MAIIIQENQNKGAAGSLIIGLVILFAVAFLVYYLFFLPAPIVDVTETPGFKTTVTFSKVKFDVEAVTNSPVWDSLQWESPVPPLSTQIISAKTNLFQSFQAR